MGRAGRKNFPPGLGELGEHGIPEGWSSYWHGAHDQLASMPASYSVISDLRDEDLQSLRTSRWSYGDLLLLAHSLKRDREWDSFDPAIEALWQHQVHALEADLRQAGMQKDSFQAFYADLRGQWERDLHNGAHVSLWRHIFESECSPDILRDLTSWSEGFDAFVRNEIAPAYKETSCLSAPGLPGFLPFAKKVLDSLFPRRQKGDMSFQDVIVKIEQEELSSEFDPKLYAQALLRNVGAKVSGTVEGDRFKQGFLLPSEAQTALARSVPGGFKPDSAFRLLSDKSPLYKKYGQKYQVFHQEHLRSVPRPVKKMIWKRTFSSEWDVSCWLRGEKGLLEIMDTSLCPPKDI